MAGTGTTQVETSTLEGGGALLSEISQGEIASSLAALSRVSEAAGAAGHPALAAGVAAFVGAVTGEIEALRHNTVGLGSTLLASAAAYEATDAQGPFSQAGR